MVVHTFNLSKRWRQKQFSLCEFSIAWSTGQVQGQPQLCGDTLSLKKESVYVRVHLHTSDHASGGLFPHLSSSPHRCSLWWLLLYQVEALLFQVPEAGILLRLPLWLLSKDSILKCFFRAPPWLPPVDPKDSCNQIPVWTD